MTKSEQLLFNLYTCFLLGILATLGILLSPIVLPVVILGWSMKRLLGID